MFVATMDLRREENTGIDAAIPREGKHNQSPLH